MRLQKYWSATNSKSDMGRQDRHKNAKDEYKKRKRSLSSSSSNDEVSTNAFDKKLEVHRAISKEERKRERQLAKEKETPEQKRQRRLLKKALKEEKRKKLKNIDLPETIPYTDTNNPFNDNNLTDVFVWNKKLEVDGKTNLSRKKIEKMSRERIYRNVAEMEELKRNRDARQAIKEDMEMMSREAERAQYSDWRRTEDTFHLNQAKLRSKIRIQEGRAKPIDLLARYAAYGNENGDDDFSEVGEFELKEPLNYMKSCTANDFEDLFSDIKVYRVIDGQKNDLFWNDITTVINAELKRIEEKRHEETGSLPHFVESDMLNIFKGKSYTELEKLNKQVCSKITNANRGTDVGYWEKTLELLNPYMAKQRLKELHANKMALRLKLIREEQSRETQKYEKESGVENFVKAEAQKSDFASTTQLVTQPSKELEDEIKEKSHVTLPFTIKELEQCDEETREKKWLLLNNDQLEHLSLQLFAYGCYSPKYGDESQAMPGIEILDEDEDRRRNEALRQRSNNTATANGSSEEHIKMMAIAQKDMSKDETTFSDEATLEQQNFLWSDKYRPRKPRYFNRVHTGFDWNKYNQTHYDIDNPPPKIVQGYRFNIFYPDLLDQSITPSFKLIECEDSDFAILRFKCGPPYEDIAFKIVNREWEINHKHGYKCQFQNGVFQLWFFFKRYRYRR